MAFSLSTFALICLATSMVAASGRPCKYQVLHDIYESAKSLHNDIREGEEFRRRRPVHCLKTSPQELLLMTSALKRVDASSLTADVQTKIEGLLENLEILLNLSPPGTDDSGLHVRSSNAHTTFCLFEVSFLIYRMAQSKISGCTPVYNVPMRRFRHSC